MAQHYYHTLRTMATTSQPPLQYQIEMAEEGAYPFNGLKPSRFQVSVREVVPFSKYPLVHELISRVVSIDSQSVIRVTGVVESNLSETYTLVYEYVPYRVDSPCPEIQDYLKRKQYKLLLLSMFKELLQLGLRPSIRHQNFGFTANFQLKMYLRLANDRGPVVLDEQEVDRTAAAMVNECEKMFDRSESGSFKSSLRSKLEHITSKLKKFQNQSFTRRKERKDESSDNSDSLAKTGGEQEKIGNAQWHFDHDFHFQDCYSEREAKKGKKKRSASFKDGQKTKSENKHKKASWGQERSSINDSDRASVLKKRITEALMKTQKTLTKYQKVRSRSPKRPPLYPIIRQEGLQ